MRNVYKAVIRDIVRRLADELVEMYGDKDKNKEELILQFMKKNENQMVNEIYAIENLFEQIEVAASDVSWPYLAEYLEEIVMKPETEAPEEIEPEEKTA